MTNESENNVLLIIINQNNLDTAVASNWISIVYYIYFLKLHH